MNNQKEWWINFLKKALLAVANIYLFLPIIRIFAPLNHFERETGLLIFLVIVSLIALFIPFWYICVPLQFGVVLYTYQQYFPLSETGWEWLKVNFEQQSRSIEQFLQGGLAIFPTNVALLLVLVLIAFSTFSLIHRLKPSFAILTCLVYLMILHVFTQYDFFASVVQVLVFSILIVGISQIPAEKGLRMALLSFLVITVSGYFFTRLALWGTQNLVVQQQWVENRTLTFQEGLEKAGFFDWVDYYSSGGGLRRMGYGENDTKLGGPLQQNFEVVFEARDDNPHYWRVATKDIYTGEGWEQSENDGIAPIEAWFGSSPPDQEVKELEIDRAADFDYFPYTYQTIDMEMNDGEFQIEIPSMEISWLGTENPSTNYVLTMVDQDIDFSSLSTASFTPENLEGADQYLALPEEIPKRVWELAESITAEKETVYEKVRAIEEYLRSGANLRYSLREASYLPEGEDYVDYFLFESKIGYCDNFSTSMIVMSRMLGIPARWAKGFNSGTKTTDENGGLFYKITNANAHSWPEIYFPGHGWLPFEPTPAFNQPLTSTENSSEMPAAENDGEREEDLLDEKEEQQPVPQIPVENTPDPSTPESESTILPEGQQPVVPPSEKNIWMQLFSVLIPILTITVILFRKKIYPLVILQLLHISFIGIPLKRKMILSLFQISERKEQSQTVRHYFERIAEKLPMHKETIQDYIFLNEVFLYAPLEEVHGNKEEEEKTLRKMVDVFEDLQATQMKSSF